MAPKLRAFFRYQSGWVYRRGFYTFLLTLFNEIYLFGFTQHQPKAKKIIFAVLHPK